MKKIGLQNNIFFVIILVLNQLSVLNAYNGFSLRFTNFRCVPNPKWFANTTCSMKAINRYKQVINLYTIPLRPLTDVHLGFKTFKRYNGWHPWILSGKINICAMLAGKINPLYNIIKKHVRKFSNINHTCPYQVGQPLFGKNIDLDNLDFGVSIIPSGFYRVMNTIYEGNTSIFNSIDEFEVKENLN